MMNLICLCGDVWLSIATTPAFIHECNCTLCTKSGARWAYPAPADVTVSGDTHGYARTDKAEPGAEIHFCPKCGSTTHFVLTPATIARHGNTMMGVNMALADEAALAGIELRYPDGRAWQGTGPFTYVRPPRIMGG